MRVRFLCLFSVNIAHFELISTILFGNMLQRIAFDCVACTKYYQLSSALSCSIVKAVEGFSIVYENIRYSYINAGKPQTDPIQFYLFLTVAMR